LIFGLLLLATEDTEVTEKNLFFVSHEVTRRNTKRGSEETEKWRNGETKKVRRRQTVRGQTIRRSVEVERLRKK
jgi:hypothetical protein